jgi:hypothetical protein
MISNEKSKKNNHIDNKAAENDTEPEKSTWLKKVEFKESAKKNQCKYVKTTESTNQNNTKNQSDKKSRVKRALSDFFRTSRPNSIKIRACNVSRGIVLAIVFLILFASIIIWFIFSSDSLDEEILANEKYRTSRHQKHNKYFTNGTNGTWPLKYGMLDLDHESLFGEKVQLSTRLFIFFCTLFIVIAIVAFVFIGSIIHHFRNPIRAKWASNASMKQNLFSSIFSYNRHSNNLYYLDQSIAREREEELRVRERNSSIQPVLPVLNEKNDSKFNEDSNSKTVPIVMIVDEV